MKIYDVALPRRQALWLITYRNGLSSIAFSPDGQRLLAASPDYLWEWDATTGEQLSRSLVPGSARPHPG